MTGARSPADAGATAAGANERARASLIINGKLPQVCDLRACSAIDAAAAAVVPLRMGDERGDALLRFGILSPLLL